jgi:hypothetical protein
VREIDGRFLVSRIKGKAALERRLRGLLLAVGRFAQHRARSRDELLWTARVLDGLHALLDNQETGR